MDELGRRVAERAAGTHGEGRHHSHVGVAGAPRRLCGIPQLALAALDAAASSAPAFFDSLKVWHDREMSPSFPFIVDNVPGFICTMTASGEVEFLNRPVLEYFGKTLVELKESALRNEVHSDDLPGVLLAWNNSVSTGEPYEIEHRLRRFDGVYRWFQARGVAERRADGGIVRWYVLLTDIEDRKRSEEIARQSHQTVRSILENIPGFVHTTSAGGEVEFISRNTLEYFGKSNEELKDWSRLDIVHPDDLPRVIESWKRSIETGQDYELEQRNRRADGVFRWFQSRGHAVRDAAGEITAWYWLNTDIDERKKAEEALRSSQRELSVIIETMPGLVWCASPDGELSYVNGRILGYLGVERNNLLAGGWAHFLHPDDVASVVAAWSNSVASGEAQTSKACRHCCSRWPIPRRTGPGRR